MLFAHGAREPAWATPFRRIQGRLRSRSPATTVELAFLELIQPSLPEVAAQLVARGVGRVTVVPLFLAQGGHLKEDLPRILADIRRAHPSLEIETSPAIGDSEALTDAIADWALRQHLAARQ